MLAKYGIAWQSSRHGLPALRRRRVRTAFARSVGRNMVGSMAKVVEEPLLKFPEAQLAQELARGEGADDSRTEQSSKQKGVHIWRIAAVVRQRKTPARGVG